MKVEKKYRIGEFSRKIHLTPTTLRYYESENLLVAQRDKTGQRFYTDSDFRWLKFILHLKGTGMTISELKEYIALRAQGDSTIKKRLQLLKQVKTRGEKEMAELADNLQVLEQKIAWYEGKQDHTVADDETFAAYLNRMKENNANE